MNRSTISNAINELTVELHEDDKLIAMCSDDSNLSKVEEIFNTTGILWHVDKACIDKAITGQCECGVAKDRGLSIACSTTTNAPRIIALIVEDISNRNLMSMLSSSTCIKVAQLFARKLAAYRDSYSKDDFANLSRFQVESILTEWGKIDEIKLLYRALDLGLVDQIVKCGKRSERGRNIMIRVMCRAMCIDFKTYQSIERLVVDKYGPMAIDAYGFDLKYNPWVFNHLLNMTVGGNAASHPYLAYNGDLKLKQLLKDPDGQQFLINCAYVVEWCFTTNCRRQTLTCRLQSFLQQLYDSAHLLPTSHWIRNFEANKVATMQTLNSRLPKDLVGLVLTYLVGNAE